MVTMRLRGFEDITRRLAALRVDVARSFLKGALRRLTEHVAEEVRRAAPVGRTATQFGPSGGTLRRSIKVAARRAFQNAQARMVVGIDHRAFYWKFIEFGTKPHPIKARRGRVLWFGGVAHKSVKHPGTQPRPFIRPTWDRIKPKLPKKFADDVSKLLKKHGLN